jgi:antitoxin (DNA-binding transcriptional repressor) of toxin-antitoxin stability system
MPTYELHYAQDNLPELFAEAKAGEEVIIVRIDGQSCVLMPTAEVAADPLPLRELALGDQLEGGLVPA